VGHDDDHEIDAPGRDVHVAGFDQAAFDVLTGSTLDWVSVAPAGDFNHADPSRTGAYRIAPADATSLISYADLAIALVDEVERPAHHREAIGIVV